MLERIENLPAGIQGLKASGKVTKEDYEGVLEPLLEEARRDGRRIRFVYELGTEFEGFTAGAAWEDVKVGLRSLRLFKGCAVVSDMDWIRSSARFAAFLLPCPVRVFGNGERGRAVEWLGSLAEAAANSHWLLSEQGVVVVDVKAPLVIQDFDALALTVDTWIEAHGELRGIVVHASEFPGWENLGSLLRHMRFIRNHHRKIKRLAVAADGKLVSIAPRIAEHFVEAETKTFAYAELEGAIAWARGSVEPTPG